ncbi:Phosphoglucan phosphatase LSF2, chloroplastic, partial [Cucurbita argyrosperma subsp. sororia]
MGASSLACFSSLFAVFPSHNNAHNKSLPFCSNPSKPLFRLNKIRCGLPESGIRQNPSSSRASSSKNRMEEYNLAMKKMMRNPYEYHHELGMNYTVIADNLIVGSQPQKPEDIDFLKEEEGVAYILNLQQDKDVEYWGIDLQSVIERCKELGIHHMRQPAKDFDPDSLRNGLPKAVSLLEWAISEGKGKAYVHCTAGLGRAPAVAIAYLYWFCGMNLNTAYEALTSKRPCGPRYRRLGEELDSGSGPFPPTNLSACNTCRFNVIRFLPG